MLSPDAVCFFPPRAGKTRRAIHSIPIGRIMALEIFHSPGDSNLLEHRQKRLRIGMEGIEQRSVPIEQNPAQLAWDSLALHGGRRVAKIPPVCCGLCCQARQCCRSKTRRGAPERPSLAEPTLVNG